MNKTVTVYTLYIEGYTQRTRLLQFTLSTWKGTHNEQDCYSLHSLHGRVHTMNKTVTVYTLYIEGYTQ